MKPFAVMAAVALVGAANIGQVDAATHHTKPRPAQHATPHTQHHFNKPVTTSPGQVSIMTKKKSKKGDQCLLPGKEEGPYLFLGKSKFNSKKSWLDLMPKKGRK